MNSARNTKSSKTQLDAMSSCSDDSDTYICKPCKSRRAIVKKLKELFNELELYYTLDPDIEEPLDEEEVIPLITYPITPQFDDSYRRKKQKPADRHPPWKLPRFPSQELIGGRLCNTCECGKRNGLQDYCQRTMCRGSLQCLQKPDPLCIPSGMWKKCVQPEEANEIIRCLNRIKEIGVDEPGGQGQQVPCSKCGHTVCKCQSKKTTPTNTKPKNDRKVNPNTANANNKKRIDNKDARADFVEMQCNDYVPPKRGSLVKKTAPKRKGASIQFAPDECF